jgi:hypothetical protein
VGNETNEEGAMKPYERRYWSYYCDDRLIVIHPSKVRVFSAGFVAGLAAAVSLAGLMQLCWCR